MAILLCLDKKWQKTSNKSFIQDSGATGFGKDHFEDHHVKRRSEAGDHHQEVAQQRHGAVALSTVTCFQITSGSENRTEDGHDQPPNLTALQIGTIIGIEVNGQQWPQTSS